MPARDIVYIRELAVEAVIGVFEWERRIRQKLTFDLEMSTDTSVAAATDELDSTLDYKAIAKRIKAYTEESEFNLVETLAERVAEIVIREFGVESLRMTVNKPGAVSTARDVGVIVQRTADDYAA